MTKTVKSNGKTKLADLIDLAFDLREKRKALEAEAAGVGVEEKAAHEQLLKLLDGAALTSARGASGQVTLSEKEVPTVTDWEKFHAYIQKTGEFDLLQKRPGEAACQARWEQNVKIPGVDKVLVRKPVLTKAK